MSPTKKVYLSDLSKESLDLSVGPLSCPLKEALVSKAHPRVYLAFDDNQQAQCPYCSTIYVKEKNGAE